MLPTSVDAALAMLAEADYLAERGLAATIYFALQLKRPVFLEGHAGVGKTEIAKVLARTLERELIRLQCFDGMDQSAAVYEWNYQRQMLAIRLAEARGRVNDEAALNRQIFSREFLLERPLLRALIPHNGRMPVLLIDELDRADEPFEAYLLEVLSDFQVSVPELGTIAAPEPPIVVITSNRTREIHDAIKRRCFYYWLDYPDAARELAILRRKLPQAPLRLAREAVAFAQQVRGLDLFKAPGVSETLDWAEALMRLHVQTLDVESIALSLGILIKYQDDLARVSGAQASKLLAAARAQVEAAAG
ncbi:MAG TPA: MoxR family ATPase [Burkholderiales bacterium]|nr:MoxR family ATPase [Burkholderiales bacterium]